MVHKSPASSGFLKLFRKCHTSGLTPDQLSQNQHLSNMQTHSGLRSCSPGHCARGLGGWTVMSSVCSKPHCEGSHRPAQLKQEASTSLHSSKLTLILFLGKNCSIKNNLMINLSLLQVNIITYVSPYLNLLKGFGPLECNSYVSVIFIYLYNFTHCNCFSNVYFDLNLQVKIGILSHNTAYSFFKTNHSF